MVVLTWNSARRLSCAIFAPPPLPSRGGLGLGRIIERVRAGMRRTGLERRHIGRRPLAIDRFALLRDRGRGQSLGQIARAHRIPRATVSRVLKATQTTARRPAQEGYRKAPPEPLNLRTRYQSRHLYQKVGVTNSRGGTDDAEITSCDY
jgi:hypothetical protein